MPHSDFAQREMRAAECHYGAEAQCREARKHARYGRDRAGRRSGLSGAGQDQDADGDQELPHPLRNLSRGRAAHQVGGEIAAAETDRRDQPPCDGGACGHEFVGVGSPQAAEIEAIARAQHVHGKRQQHAGYHGAGHDQAARKIGRLGHGPLVR